MLLPAAGRSANGAAAGAMEGGPTVDEVVRDSDSAVGHEEKRVETQELSDCMAGRLLDHRHGSWASALAWCASEALFSDSSLVQRLHARAGAVARAGAASCGCDCAAGGSPSDSSATDGCGGRGGPSAPPRLHREAEEAEA